MEEKKEQTEFTVKLTAFDDGGKVKLIKEIKSIVEGMNLVQVQKINLSLVRTQAIHSVLVLVKLKTLFFPF